MKQILLIVVSLVATSTAFADDTLTVLEPATKPADAYENWLLSEFNKLCDRRSEAFELMIKSESACTAWQQDRKAFFLDRIGETETGARRKAFGAGLFGRDNLEIFTAYLMGKSYVGMRTDDARSWLYFLKAQFSDVSLIAIGETAIPALHAAALEPAAFKSITLRRMIPSWESLVGADGTLDQTVNMVHGILKHYDLPDLIQLVGQDRITIEQPLNGMGGKME